MNVEGGSLTLTGKYTRTIKIFLICIIALIITGMVISSGWNIWYLFLPEIIPFVLWLYPASRSIKVEVRSGWLYLRNKRIDVTRRIHQIKRQNENMITIRFNFLYQLNIMGDQEQINQVEEQLKHKK